MTNEETAQPAELHSTDPAAHAKPAELGPDPGFDETQPHTIELRVPVSLGEGDKARVVTHLTLQPLTGRDLFQLRADLTSATHGDFLQVAATMAGEPVAVVKRLQARDLAAVFQVVNRFFAIVQGTG